VIDIGLDVCDKRVGLPDGQKKDVVVEGTLDIKVIEVPTKKVVFRESWIADENSKVQNGASPLIFGMSQKLTFNQLLARLRWSLFLEPTMEE
jgi:hypothetical protein